MAVFGDAFLTTAGSNIDSDGAEVNYSREGARFSGAEGLPWEDVIE